MQGLRATRLRLGFTQEVFALELGISRSFLALCEKGARSLTPAALQKLSLIEIELDRNAKAGRKAVTLPAAWTMYRNETARIQFNDEALQSQMMASDCGIKLQKMIDRHNRILQQVAEVEMLLESTASGNGGPFLPTHLILHRDMLLSKLEDCDLHAQTVLRHKISLHLAAASLYKSSASPLTESTSDFANNSMSP